MSEGPNPRADRPSADVRRVAFRDLLRNGRDLVLGRRPRSLADADRAARAEERWRQSAARQRIDRGDPAGALVEAAEIERVRPASEVAATIRQAAARTAAIRGRETARLDPDSIRAAQAQLRAEGVARPIVLLYHQASPDNPFQTLLYRRAWANGIAAIALNDLDDLPVAEAAIEPGTGQLLHLHWVNKVIHGAATAAEAEARVAVAVGRLDAARAAGWTIAWTVHNILPHDSDHHAAQASLRQAIADRASVIHVMTAGTAELARPWFTLPPERTIHVPLPSFDGAYPDIVDRSAARFALDLPGDARVVALVGGLRPYKGLDLLLDAFERAAERSPTLHLLIAGQPAPGAEIAAFLERAGRHPRIHLHARMIPADDLQLFLRASDAAVLPYVRTLNSAVLMLVLAFELPVIAPDLGGIPETVDPAIATIVPAGDVEALAAALERVEEPTPDARAAARRISEAHDAATLSNRLMTALRDAVERAGSEG